MNELAATTNPTLCCASCGKAEAEVDDVKLRKCACKLVRYCSVDCQKNHRPQHKRTCKKRLVELRDEKLFKQPDGSYLGDCPICCLPFPLGLAKSSISIMLECCSKWVCKGCLHANMLRSLEKSGSFGHKCPFCREPTVCSNATMEEAKKKDLQLRMKRVEANDPIALTNAGFEHYVEGNYEEQLNI